MDVIAQIKNSFVFMLRLKTRVIIYFNCPPRPNFFLNNKSFAHVNQRNKKNPWEL